MLLRQPGSPGNPRNSDRVKGKADISLITIRLRSQADACRIGRFIGLEPESHFFHFFLRKKFAETKIIPTFALAIVKVDASLAQLVEHDTLNVGVQGSSP